jgi:hypothetical protein
MSPWMDLSAFTPASPSQYHTISVILITSQVRPSSTLDEDLYGNYLGVLFVKSRQTLGIKSPALRRTRASMKWCDKYITKKFR